MMKTMKSLWSSPYFADAEIFSGIVSVQAHYGLEQCVGVLERGRGKDNENATQSGKSLSLTHINFLSQTVLTEPVSVN